MELSVVIVNWNGGALLRRCLESIYRNEGEIELEVLVVDNNSSDGSPSMVRDRFPQVQLIRNEANLGFAQAANQGIRRSRANCVFVSNPDIEVKPNSLERMLDLLDERRGVGAVGGKLLNPDGTVQMRGYYNQFPSPGQVLMNYTALGRVLSSLLKDRVDWDKRGPVDQSPGGCTLFRRKALENVGGFDEDFFLWFEDVDLCYRLRKGGWDIYYLPSCEFVHYGGKSIGLLEKEERERLFFASMFRYFRKHFRRRDILIAKWVMLSDLVLKVLLGVTLWLVSSKFREFARRKWAVLTLCLARLQLSRRDRDWGSFRCHQ